MTINIDCWNASRFSFDLQALCLYFLNKRLESESAHCSLNTSCISTHRSEFDDVTFQKRNVLFVGMLAYLCGKFCFEVVEKGQKIKRII